MVVFGYTSCLQPTRRCAGEQFVRPDLPDASAQKFGLFLGSGWGWDPSAGQSDCHPICWGTVFSDKPI